MGLPDLQFVRESLGRTPRKLSWLKQPPINIPMPSWLEKTSEKDDRLKELFWMLRKLWKEGDIRWGRVIKANRLLYDSGVDDCPGELLFSLTATDEEAAAQLSGYVERLHSLPDQPQESLNECERNWQEDLMDDLSFHLSVRLPQEWLPPGQEYRASTTLFHRAHLPGGKIRHRLMPILVLPQHPSWAVVLPIAFWPPALIKWLDESHAIADVPSRPPPLPPMATIDARESAYREVFGEIESVFHETEFRSPHIDIYSFRREDDGPFWTFASGGMSDVEQANARDPIMRRVELVFHVREKNERYVNLLRNLAHFPFETGRSLEGGHTVPLGEHAEAALGTTRFKVLLFAAAMRLSDKELAGRAIIDGQPMYPLMVIPITERELEIVHAEGALEMLERIRAAGFSPIFDLNRPCCVEGAVE